MEVEGILSKGLPFPQPNVSYRLTKIATLNEKSVRLYRNTCLLSVKIVIENFSQRALTFNSDRIFFPEVGENISSGKSLAIIKGTDPLNIIVKARILERRKGLHVGLRQPGSNDNSKR